MPDEASGIAAVTIAGLVAVTLWAVIIRGVVRLLRGAL